MPFDAQSDYDVVIETPTQAAARELKKTQEARRRAQQRMMQAAERYIAADRTDPFTRARTRTHIQNGVASIHRGDNRDYELSPGPAFYSADSQMVDRKIDMGSGRVSVVPTIMYTNVVRP